MNFKSFLEAFQKLKFLYAVLTLSDHPRQFQQLMMNNNL
jgi:hypothetical protein